MLTPTSFLHRFTCLIAAIVLNLSSVFAQQTFQTAEAAADALIDAVSTRNQEALRTILGARWKEFVPTDEIRNEDVDAFVSAARASHRILQSDEGRAELEVGHEGWTLPIPLRQNRRGWRFDVRQAEEVIRTRRVGRNELAVIDALRAYVDAQRDYAELDRNGDGILEYAHRLLSTDNQRDGLYWSTEPGEPLSPLGPLFGGVEPGQEFYGYRYRILTAQGPHAEGGARSYLIGGRLTGGFALVAWPARYDDSGVMTFIVNHQGRVYQKDLGRRTASRAGKITAFDPGDGWTEANASP